MKKYLLFILMMLILQNTITHAQDKDNRQLWLLTAKVSVKKTYRRDTLNNVSMDYYRSEKIFHQSSQTSASGTITAVVENQAENPLTEFVYTSGGDEPVSIRVTGEGTHTSTDRSSETINGKFYTGDNRTDNVSGSALPDADIQFTYSRDYKAADISIKIMARGSSNAQTFSSGEWVDYGGPIEDYLIWCDGGCDCADDKNCNITKNGNGYSARWNSTENDKANTSNGTEYRTTLTSLEITVVPYKESDKPVITIEGCTSLAVGETETITLAAKPEGGSFKFWVEPSDLMNASANDATATITGRTPGQGVLMAEYTTADGKTAQTSVEASCVKIVSYNEGQAIPQIALYDLNGKKKDGVITVPLSGQPENAADLVKFEAADPGVLTAVGLGNKVTLQGVRLGKTTLQATTKCGEKTGPSVEVEVVNCDDETIARLEKMEKAAEENFRTAINECQNANGSPEFQKARNELLGSFNQMMLKIGLTIITNAKAPTKAIGKAADIADDGTALSEIIASSNPQELRNNIGKPAAGKSFEKIVENTFGEAVSNAYGKALSGAIAVLEVGEAAQKVCDNASTWALYDQMIEDLMKKMEKAESEYKFVKSRQQLCARQKEKTDNNDIPLADLKPIPGEQAPKQNQTSKTEATTVEQPQNNEPPTIKQTGDDDIIVDPEPPVIPPRQVGLPYEPDNCGCDNTKSLTVSSKDLSTLRNGIQNLSDCINRFNNTSVKDYQDALKELTELTGTLSSLMKKDAEAFLVKAKEVQPQLDDIVKRIRAYEKAGSVFQSQMEKCSESVTIGMDIFQSVEKVTVESIKTDY